MIPYFFFFARKEEVAWKLHSGSLDIYVCDANISFCYGKARRKLRWSLHLSIQFSNEEFFTQDLSVSDVSLLQLVLLFAVVVVSIYLFQCASHFIFHNRNVCNCCEIYQRRPKIIEKVKNKIFKINTEVLSLKYFAIVFFVSLNE